jgi:hypothetical protein
MPYFWWQKGLVLAQMSFWSPMGLKDIIWLEPLSDFMEYAIVHVAIRSVHKA